MAVFVVDIRVRFSHVDQAGLIFYPRYFEMFNEVIEEWFDRGLDCSFRQLHGGAQMRGPGGTRRS